MKGILAVKCIYIFRALDDTFKSSNHGSHWGECQVRTHFFIWVSMASGFVKMYSSRRHRYIRGPLTHHRVPFRPFSPSASLVTIRHPPLQVVSKRLLPPEQQDMVLGMGDHMLSLLKIVVRCARWALSVRCRYHRGAIGRYHCRRFAIELLR